MHAVYIGNQKMMGKTIWGGRFIFSSEDMSLAPELICSGFIELGLTKFFNQHLAEGHTFLDIGTNIGYYTVLAGMKVGSKGKVYGFEANPSTYQFLKDNVAINYTNPQTELFNKAVYSENKEISFYTTERFSGNASIHKPDEKYYDYFLVDKGLIEQKVEAVKIDDFIPQTIDYAKIDVEGGEYHCIKGMRGSILNGLVKNIIFEINQVRSKEDSKNLFDLLSELEEKAGVRFFVINSNGEAIPFSLKKIFEHEFIPAVLMKR